MSKTNVYDLENSLKELIQCIDDTSSFSMTNGINQFGGARSRSKSRKSKTPLEALKHYIIIWQESK